MWVLRDFYFTYFVFLTQEVEFGRKWQSVSIRNERVVSSILRLHVINNQSMKPELNHRGVMCVDLVSRKQQWYTLLLKAAPSNVSHFDAITGQDLHSIFEPLSCDLVIRHLTFEHRLVCCLDRQICDVLQHLQLFL